MSNVLITCHICTHVNECDPPTSATDQAGSGPSRARLARSLAQQRRSNCCCLQRLHSPPPLKMKAALLCASGCRMQSSYCPARAPSKGWLVPSSPLRPLSTTAPSPHRASKLFLQPPSPGVGRTVFSHAYQHHLNSEMHGGCSLSLRSFAPKIKFDSMLEVSPHRDPLPCCDGQASGVQLQASCTSPLLLIGP